MCAEQYRLQNIEHIIQNTGAAKLMNIKLPMYLFYMALGLNDFDWANPKSRAI
jgi:hypothetical protein